MQAVYLWFWRLLPGNPMVVRIVQGGSRRLRDLWLRMGYLGGMIALVLVGLLAGGGMGQDKSLADLAKAGTFVFSFIAYGQVILVCLLAPLFMAGAIGSEQSGKTYDILLTTPLSNLQIVLGSLLGRLFFVLALLLSGLPLFSVLLIFGGVPVSSVFMAFALAGLTAVFVGSVAITLSVFRAGGRKAVFVFVISIAAFLVATYAADLLVLRMLPGAAEKTTLLTPINPLLVLESSINRANYAPPTAEELAGYPAPIVFYLSRPFAAFATLTAIASLGMVIACAVVLRRIGQGESLWWWKLKKKLRIGRTARVRKARTVGRNPIAWRESHTRGKVAAGIVARYGFLVLGLLLAVGLLAAYHFDALPKLAISPGQKNASAALFHSVLITLLLLEVAVITLVAIYMSAGSVSKEREDGTLDIMLTTPITPKYYIWGKLQGLVRYLSLMIAAPVGTLLLVSAYSGFGYLLGWEQATFEYRHVQQFGGGAVMALRPLLVPPEAGVLLAIMLVPFVALCVAAGMGWSLKARGVLGAVVPTVAIVGALTLVLGLCGYQTAANIPFVGPVVNAFSPTTNLMMIVDPWSTVSGYPEHPPAHRLVMFLGALICAAGYSGIVYALILGMVKGFDHTVRKLSGTG